MSQRGSNTVGISVTRKATAHTSGQDHVGPAGVLLFPPLSPGIAQRGEYLHAVVRAAPSKSRCWQMPVYR